MSASTKPLPSEKRTDAERIRWRASDDRTPPFTSGRLHAPTTLCCPYGELGARTKLLPSEKHTKGHRSAEKIRYLHYTIYSATPCTVHRIPCEGRIGRLIVGGAMGRENKAAAEREAHKRAQIGRGNPLPSLHHILCRTLHRAPYAV